MTSIDPPSSVNREMLSTPHRDEDRQEAHEAQRELGVQPQAEEKSLVVVRHGPHSPLEASMEPVGEEVRRKAERVPKEGETTAGARPGLAPPGKMISCY